MTSNEKNLVERFRSGDDDAFDELYRLSHERIYRFALRLTGNAQDAEDVAVQVFAEAHRGRLGFNGQSTVETWLYRIAVHVAGKVRRKRKPQENLDHEAADPNAERHVRALELRELIVQLPTHVQVPFVLVKIEGLTHREAAEVLGRKLGTVQSQVFEACRLLRAQLIAEPAPRLSENPERCVL